MKRFLPVLLLLLSGFGYPQKYILLDKKMSQPVSYTNTVTIEHGYKGFFAVESDKIRQFISEVEKISDLLSSKQPLPEAIDFSVGKTKFLGVKVSLAKQERLDVVLTTNCDGVKITMHLCDPNISNANNVFFINTWLKYIKSSLKG